MQIFTADALYALSIKRNTPTAFRHPVVRLPAWNIYPTSWLLVQMFTLLFKPVPCQKNIEKLLSGRKSC